MKDTGGNERSRRHRATPGAARHRDDPMPRGAGIHGPRPVRGISTNAPPRPRPHREPPSAFMAPGRAPPRRRPIPTRRADGPRTPLALSRVRSAEDAAARARAVRPPGRACHHILPTPHAETVKSPRWSVPAHREVIGDESTGPSCGGRSPAPRPRPGHAPGRPGHPAGTAAREKGRGHFPPPHPDHPRPRHHPYKGCATGTRTMIQALR